MSSAPSLDVTLNRLQRWSLTVAIIGIALCLVGFLFDRQQFFRAYLLSYVFWWGITIGCLALTMLYQMVGGAWGYVSRPYFEAGTQTIIALAVLVLPLAFGLDHIYEWTHSASSASEEMGRNKQLYLDRVFFLGRTAGYFLVWILLAVLLTTSLVWPDERRRAATTEAMGRLSGGGMVLLVLTVTFAAIDWLMTLNHHWHSTIFGGLIAIGNLMMGMAIVIASIAWTVRWPSRPGTASPVLLNDLGNLLLAFVMLWAYFSLSQLLIIWSGNLPHEAAWYEVRSHNGWQFVAAAIALFHFVIPFFLLLSRDIKRDPPLLGSVAIVLLFMHYVDLYWTIVPTFAERITVHWLHFAMPAAIGGIWLTVYARQLRDKLMPVLDDILEPDAEARARENLYA